MTDLIKRLRAKKQFDSLEFDTLEYEAADRIQELEARNQELTLQLLATSGQAADALDKLDKAIAALRFVKPLLGNSFVEKRAIAMLAELEGGSELQKN